MDRRSFLKTLMSLGVSINLPLDLANASDEDIDAAWGETVKAWGLFEVDDYGTLSDAEFEEPKTRREAYGYSGPSELSSCEIEQLSSLRTEIQWRYRATLEDEAAGDFDEDEMDQRVEDGWAEWFDEAQGADRTWLDETVEEWLDGAPDWESEGEDLYRTGTAQGAAYYHFMLEPREVLDALGIVIIEGDCPGSSYFAAELRMPIEEANRIAEARGWDVRFVTEG